MWWFDTNFCALEKNLSRVSPTVFRSAALYGLLALMLLAVGILLARDIWFERVRVLEEAALQAKHKSQIMGRSFGDTFLATDYVLRDVLGHIEDPADLAALPRMSALLKRKHATLTGVLNLSVLDKDCIFRSSAELPELVGRRSNQRLCSAPQHPAGETLYIQYIPTEKSLNGKPSILMTRVLASSQGQMQAGAFAVISLDYAQQWISAFETADDDTLTLVDPEGIVLARKPHLASAIGQRTSPPEGHPRFADMKGQLHDVAIAPLDQRARVYGLSPLERVPFVAIAGVSEERTLRSWHRRIVQFGVGFALLVALSIWLVRSHLRVLAQRDTMKRLATTDGLTGIANRRHFLAAAEHEARRANRYQLPYSVVMLDVDHFKRINDQWGHPTGDRAICAVARSMAQAARSMDCVARIGGEEFVVLLPETKAEGAAVLAERLRALVENTTEVLSDDATVVRFTVSLGVASREEGEAPFDSVLLRADQALYQAKTQGRNRVVVAGV